MPWFVPSLTISHTNLPRKPCLWFGVTNNIHSFGKIQSRVVKGQADWEKFFGQVGTNEIWRCWSLWP
jgi:hypothetical protein